MAKEPDFENAPMGDEDMSDDMGLDEEFEMYAADAGFEGEKAKALKMAIERCMSLQSEGSYDEDEEALDLEL